MRELPWHKRKVVVQRSLHSTAASPQQLANLHCIRGVNEPGIHHWTGACLPSEKALVGAALPLARPAAPRRHRSACARPRVPSTAERRVPATELVLRVVSRGDGLRQNSHRSSLFGLHLCSVSAPACCCAIPPCPVCATRRLWWAALHSCSGAVAQRLTFASARRGIRLRQRVRQAARR